MAASFAAFMPSAIFSPAALPSSPASFSGSFRLKILSVASSTRLSARSKASSTSFLNVSQDDWKVINRRNALNDAPVAFILSESVIKPVDASFAIFVSLSKPETRRSIMPALSSAVVADSFKALVNRFQAAAKLCTFSPLS